MTKDTYVGHLDFAALSFSSKDMEPNQLVIPPYTELGLAFHEVAILNLTFQLIDFQAGQFKISWVSLTSNLVYNLKRLVRLSKDSWPGHNPLNILVLNFRYIGILALNLPEDGQTANQMT